MVYKIRNKSFFWTRAGWKNNWHPKNFNSPRPSNTETTIGIRCRNDHNSFLRGKNIYVKNKKPITHTEKSQDIADNTFMVAKSLK